MRDWSNTRACCLNVKSGGMETKRTTRACNDTFKLNKEMRYKDIRIIEWLFIGSMLSDQLVPVSRRWQCTCRSHIIHTDNHMTKFIHTCLDQVHVTAVWQVGTISTCRQWPGTICRCWQRKLVTQQWQDLRTHGMSEVKCEQVRWMNCTTLTNNNEWINVVQYLFNTLTSVTRLFSIDSPWKMNLTSLPRP